MIEIAKKNIEKEKADIKVSLSDIRSFEPQQQYDAVISLFHVMSYQTKNQDILSAFQAAGNALKKVDYFYLMSGMGQAY